MLSPNTVPWHIDYFELKEFETWQVGKFSLTSPDSPEEVIRPSCGGKAAPVPLKAAGHPEKQGGAGPAPQPCPPLTFSLSPPKKQRGQRPLPRRS